MPQYDVHLNPGPMRETVPMVVLVQSSLFDGYRRRVVVPLVLRSALPAGAKVSGTRMNPVFKIKGQVSMSDAERLLERIEQGIASHGGDLGGWTKLDDDRFTDPVVAAQVDTAIAALLQHLGSRSPG